MSELSLPTVAFCLKGYGDYIQLTIDEVFGYPNETSFGGGYGAKGNIQISVGGYKVDSQYYFTTGELFRFRQSLMNGYDNLSGIATLDNTEGDFELSVSFNKSGKVQIFGCFQERLGINNKLIFEIESDQTYVLPVIQQLNLVQKIFGDMKGISLPR